MSKHWAIETENLSKNFDRTRAVDNVSLRVAEGEIYAFLGLNGAGKTTTMRMLLGMIKPTAGRASILGMPVAASSGTAWASVGYLIEQPRHYPELTVRQNLEATRRLRPSTPQKNRDAIIERLGLQQYADTRADRLSQGNAQRLGIARALMHRPEVLLLDEPINGLDPAGIIEIRALLQELAEKEHVTIFLSSHILAEVARIAQRIGIIHQGQLIRELDRAALLGERRKKLVIRVADPARAGQILENLGHPFTLVGEGLLTLAGKDAITDPHEINRQLVLADCPPSQLSCQEEDLETYFLRLISPAKGPHDA
ncbi:MAG: ABC transporter ATP-binding protein [Candidatus Dependentiae bacterium]|nr:ABC transporter ATP-binding protein [Candidatus Dependentiae bacterium]